MNAWSKLSAIRVFNGAAVVVEVESGEVLAYVGKHQETWAPGTS